MRPLRRKKTIEITDNPITGQVRILNATNEANIFSDEGSIDSSGVHHIFFLDCGCTAAAFGRCYKCGAISCQTHHGICHNCQMPICLQCSTFQDTPNQTNERYCRRCFDTIARKQSLKKIGRFFLSAFLKKDDSNG
jgi:hypothetical protein